MSRITRTIYRQARRINRSCASMPNAEIYSLPREDRLSVLFLAESCFPLRVDPLEEKSRKRKTDAQWRALGW